MEDTQQQPQDPVVEVPEIPKPPSAKAAPPQPPAPAPVPVVPPAPPEDVEARKAAADAMAIAEAVKAELAKRDEEAVSARRLQFASAFGGGLKRPLYEQLLPKVDPATAEGAKAIEDFLRANPELVNRPPAAPLPERTPVEQKIARFTGGRSVMSVLDISGGRIR